VIASFYSIFPNISVVERSQNPDSATVMSLCKKHNKVTAIFLVAIILILCGGGATIHYCFDGNEPAVSLNFGNVISNYDNPANEGDYVDSDKTALSDNLSKNSFNIATLFLVTALFLFIIPLAQVTRYSRVPNTIPWIHYFIHLPPTRAPPRYS